jgi:hypothetical protein
MVPVAMAPLAVSVTPGMPFRQLTNGGSACIVEAKEVA